MLWANVEWGSVGEWVAGLGTVAALVAVYSEIRARHRQEEARRLAHARQLLITCGGGGGSPTHSWDTDADARNVASEPFFDVVIDVRWAGGHRETVTFDDVPPGERKALKMPVPVSKEMPTPGDVTWTAMFIDASGISWSIDDRHVLERADVRRTPIARWLRLGGA